MLRAKIACQHFWDRNLVIDVSLHPKSAKVNVPKFTGGYSLLLLPEF